MLTKSIVTVLVLCAVLSLNAQVVPLSEPVPNETATGTLANKFASKSSGGLAITSPANVQTGIIGVVIGNNGITGSALIQKFGAPPGGLFSDTDVVAGHYITLAVGTAGVGTDAGTSCPAGGALGFWTQTGTGTGPWGAIIDGNVCPISPAAGMTNPMTTAGDIIYGGSSGTPTRLATGTAKKLLIAGTTPSYIDFPDVKIIPAANCVNAVAGSGVSSTSTGFTATCRAGSNNFNGVLNGIPSATATAYFDYELPGDWDTAVKPYIAVYYGSGANTSGTVIWTISTACTKQDGSVTDDPSWIAESAMGTQTMATANRMWAQSAQLAGAMTNCIAGSTMLVKLALSGTASSAIQVSKATITVPRLLTVQAN